MLNKNKDAKRLVEAILFAADEPLDIETIKSKIELNVDVLIGKIKISKKTNSLVFVVAELFEKTNLVATASGTWKII